MKKVSSDSRFACLDNPKSKKVANWLNYKGFHLLLLKHCMKSCVCTGMPITTSGMPLGLMPRQLFALDEGYGRPIK